VFLLSLYSVVYKVFSKQSSFKKSINQNDMLGKELKYFSFKSVFVVCIAI